MDNKEDKDIKNEVCDIVENVCKLLNDNYKILVDVAPTMNDGDICKLFSLYTNQYDKRNTEFRVKIKEIMKQKSGFKLVSDNILNEKFNEIWKSIKRHPLKWHYEIDCAVFKIICGKRLNGVLSEMYTINELCRFDDKKQSFEPNIRAINDKVRAIKEKQKTTTKKENNAGSTESQNPKENNHKKQVKKQ